MFVLTLASCFSLFVGQGCRRKIQTFYFLCRRLFCVFCIYRPFNNDCDICQTVYVWPALLGNPVSVNAASGFCTDVPGGGKVANISSAICEGLLTGSVSDRLFCTAILRVRNTSYFATTRERERESSGDGKKKNQIIECSVSVQAIATHMPLLSALVCQKTHGKQLLLFFFVCGAGPRVLAEGSKANAPSVQG